MEVIITVLGIITKTAGTILAIGKWKEMIAGNPLLAVLSVVVIVGVLVVSNATGFFGKWRIIKGKAKHFRAIRKEYAADRISGYFALQQYFGSKLKTDEMDFILNSPFAYSIFILLKPAIGKYEFIGGKFTAKVTKRRYIIPAIAYFLSCAFFVPQLVLYGTAIKETSLIINAAVCLPIIIFSLWSISGTSCALKLAKLTGAGKKG